MIGSSKRMLTLRSDLAVEAAAEAIAMAAAKENTHSDEHILESLLTLNVRGIARGISRSTDPPLRAWVSGQDVVVKPVYEEFRHLAQRFRGHLLPSAGGSVLEGRVTTAWWGKAFFGISLGIVTPLWVLVLGGTALEAIQSPDPTPLMPLGVVTTLFAAGWFIFWSHWRQAQKERAKIVGFLHRALGAV